ncbi:MAG: hydroxymethylglutaryl-CoA synthase family protein [Candidatus Freyarchaeota archaeon]|nr:hydroxymethylglutaryl-CoA synthase family protein [Candidatus Jordarchaeia archaeon]MBS7269417.1 hydroxymethylglutaryl-CoA synthase family protein [Candidatus Jordarchaeia archaeon]MBS7280205.1 hydroxymethylglutaryl-CoA synthase family protein [Candidatus Jordarchaeia archaeon]
MVGIKACGAYIPLYSLSRELIAKAWDFPPVPGSRALANNDEDSITMAVEAGWDCLHKIEPKTVDGVYFATTTAPYAEKQGAALIAAALDMRKDVQTIDFTDSLRAGTTAMIAAYNAIKSGTANSILVVASDCRIAEPESMFEFQMGDGAAAILLSKDDVGATIEGFHTVSEEFTGPWRRAKDTYIREFEVKHDGIYGFANQVGAVLMGLAQKYKLDPKSVSKLIMYAPDPRAPVEIAKRMGVDAKNVQDTMFFSIGNTGTALAPMMLVAALEQAQPNQKMVVVGVGDGADALLLNTTDKVAQVKGKRGITGHIFSMKPLKNYNEYLRNKQLLERERFSRRTSTVIYYRDKAKILNLHGMKCKACGTIQYPIQRVCFECGTKDNWEEIRLPKTGKVFTFTLDHLVGGEYLVTPVPRIIVNLDGGGKIFLEMTDCEPNEVKIDMPVELTFRWLHESAYFRHYYWKCRPVRGGIPT